MFLVVLRASVSLWWIWILLYDQAVVGIPGIYFQRLIQRTDGHLQLSVVRLAGSQALQGQTGCDNHLHQGMAVVLGTPPEELVGDAGNQRQQHDTRTCLEVKWPQLGDQRENSNTDQHDDQQE